MIKKRQVLSRRQSLFRLFRFLFVSKYVLGISHQSPVVPPVTSLHRSAFPHMCTVLHFHVQIEKNTFVTATQGMKVQLCSGKGRAFSPRLESLFSLI